MLTFTVTGGKLAPGESTSPRVQVSVASGEHTHLSGVLGAPVSADELARQLAARGFDGLLANLVADSQGVTHIRWLPPHNGPQQDRFQEVRP